MVCYREQYLNTFNRGEILVSVRFTLKSCILILIVEDSGCSSIRGKILKMCVEETGVGNIHHNRGKIYPL